jgi:hypothetical protein
VVADAVHFLDGKPADARPAARPQAEVAKPAAAPAVRPTEDEPPF